MISSSKFPPRIQSAPPDEGEPNLRTSYNIHAPAFDPNIYQKPKVAKKELRADAVDYCPSFQPAKIQDTSFNPVKTLSANSDSFEFSKPFSFSSININSISDFSPKDLDKYDFVPESFGKITENPLNSEETQASPASPPASENKKDAKTDIPKPADSLKLEIEAKELEIKEPSEVETTSPENPESKCGDPDRQKKKVYDFEAIKNFKLDFLKNPNFLVVSPEIQKIKERVVEVLRSRNSRRGEDRKLTREPIGRVVWRKEKTAEEEKIYNKAKEYQRKFSVTENEIKQIARSVRITLNKLTPSNLDRLLDSILETCKKSHDYLKLVVSGVFEKAWAEKKYTQMYSSICKYLKSQFENFRYPDVEESKLPKTRNYFKYELLYMCEETFVKNHEEAIPEGVTESEKQERLSKIKQKTLGNVRFIGELFNVNLITAKIVLGCVTGLLDNFEREANEDKLEGACLLLLTGSTSFERSALKMETNLIYERLEKIMSSGVSTRIKFKILDLKENRANGWQGMKREEVKTVEEVHLNHYQEQNEILRRHGYN